MLSIYSLSVLSLAIHIALICFGDYCDKACSNPSTFITLREYDPLYRYWLQSLFWCCDAHSQWSESVHESYLSIHSYPVQQSIFLFIIEHIWWFLTMFYSTHLESAYFRCVMFCVEYWYFKYSKTRELKHEIIFAWLRYGFSIPMWSIYQPGAALIHWNASLFFWHCCFFWEAK